MRHTFHSITLFFLLISFGTWSQSDSTLLTERTPEWATAVLEKSELYKNYMIIDTVNPFYFEADFTGDEITDIVFLVKHKLSEEVGIFIINGGKNNCFVLGAGKDIGMGHNIKWVTKWFVYRNKYIYNFEARKKKLQIKHPAIEIRKNDQRSIIVYWDRRRYKTYLKNTK